MLMFQESKKRHDIFMYAKSENEIVRFSSPSQPSSLFKSHSYKTRKDLKYGDLSQPKCYILWGEEDSQKESNRIKASEKNGFVAHKISRFSSFSCSYVLYLFMLIKRKKTSYFKSKQKYYIINLKIYNIFWVVKPSLSLVMKEKLKGLMEKWEKMF